MNTVSTIRTVGIIGLGSFGRFAASLVPTEVRTLGFDESQTNTIPGVEKSRLQEVAAADVVILAVPLGALPSVLDNIKALLKPDTVVMDVCSVKTRPGELIAEHLPGHANVLLTHPLFGPQSAATSTKGHKLIVTKCEGSKASDVLKFCNESLGLDIQNTDASAHDAAMAQVHALTFFVARGLAGMDLRQGVVSTPSYQMILDLIGLDKAHSEELFRTIQLGNPFAQNIRRELLNSLTQVERELEVAEAGHEV